MTRRSAPQGPGMTPDAGCVQSCGREWRQAPLDVQLSPCRSDRPSCPSRLTESSRRHRRDAGRLGNCRSGPACGRRHEAGPWWGGAQGQAKSPDHHDCRSRSWGVVHIDEDSVQMQFAAFIIDKARTVPWDKKRLRPRAARHRFGNRGLEPAWHSVTALCAQHHQFATVA